MGILCVVYMQPKLLNAAVQMADKEKTDIELFFIKIIKNQQDHIYIKI